MNSDAFKDRLKIAMGGESNHSFAIKCRVSEGSLRNYLKGGTSPDLKTLQVIAEVSGCSMAWLASGDGEMKRGEDTAVSNMVYEAPVEYDIKTTDPRHEWFHEWIDEELQGKSISEIMAMAVKIKSVLDEK